MNKLIDEISRSVTPEAGLSEALALELGGLADADAALLFPVTRSLRRSASGNKVYLCSIVNAKSGRCAEDCRFCAQSVHYRTGAAEYPLLSETEMVAAARDARSSGAGEFSIVTSGKGVWAEDEVVRIERTISEIVRLGLHSCVSPGIVGRDTMERWKNAGLTRFHHNLEAAPSFIGQVRTTRPIPDRGRGREEGPEEDAGERDQRRGLSGEYDGDLSGGRGRPGGEGGGPGGLQGH